VNIFKDLAGVVKDKLKASKDGTTVGVASEPCLSEVVGRISTGCTPLDCILGGGIPRGRITEILGPPHEGKSTLLEHIIKSNQDANGICMLLLSEACMDKARMKRIGVDLEKLFLCEVGSLEDGFDIIFHCLKKIEEKFDEYKDAPVLVGWDTISAAPNRHELEGDNYGGGLGYTPRIIRAGLRKIEMQVARTRTALVFVGQTIADIGSYYPMEDSPGGGGIKFNSSVRMYVKKKEILYLPDKTSYGLLSKVFTRKNKTAPPRREALVPIFDYDGINNDLAMYYYLKESHFEAKGRYWHVLGPEGKRTQFSWNDFYKAMEETPGLRDFLKSECLRVYQEKLPGSMIDKEE